MPMGSDNFPLTKASGSLSQVGKLEKTEKTRVLDSGVDKASLPWQEHVSNTHTKKATY